MLPHAPARASPHGPRSRECVRVRDTAWPLPRGSPLLLASRMLDSCEAAVDTEDIGEVVPMKGNQMYIQLWVKSVNLQVITKFS